MFVDEKEVASAYRVPVEIFRKWVDTKYISGNKGRWLLSNCRKRI